MPKGNAIYARQARATASAAAAPTRAIPLRPSNGPPLTAAEIQRNKERAAAIKQFWTEVRQLDAAAAGSGSDEVALLAMREEPAASGSLLALVRPVGSAPDSLVKKLNNLRANGEAKAPPDGALHKLMDGDT